MGTSWPTSSAPEPPAFRGRGDSGPQGEPKASRDEARKGDNVSDEL